MPAPSSPPDGRRPRRRLDADQRRTQIYRATTEVVATRGFTNATLTEIAGHAGLAKGLLWHYFTDRDDLMHQTLGFLSLAIRDAVVADLDLTAGVPELVRAVLGRTAMLTRTHSTELEAVDQIVHNLRSPDGRQRITMTAYDATYAEHERLLARGQSEGSIRDGDVRTMAVSYQGVIDAMIGYLQAHPDIDPLTQSAAVADVLLTGIATDRGHGPGGTLGR